jgi:hypothetical protein
MKVPFFLSGTTVQNLNTTTLYYNPEMGGILANCSSAVEAEVEKWYRRSGRIGGLTVVVTVNSRTVDGRFVSRKNGADGNQLVLVPPSTTGTFTDVTNTDLVEDGDRYSVGYIYIAGAGSGTITLTGIGGWFDDADGDAVSQLTTVRFNNNGNNLLRYSYLVSQTFGITSTESIVQTITKTAGTYKNMAVYVSVNPRNAPMVLTFRKNESDTDLKITIPALGTGLFENTTDEISVIEGDRVAWKYESGASTETMQHDISVEFVSTKGLCMGSRGATIAQGTTVYAGLTGWGSSWSATEDGSQMAMPIGGTMSVARLKITANTLTGDCVFTLRKNGVDTGIVITVPAGTVGDFTEAVPATVLYQSGDLFGWKAVAPAGGTTITVQSLILDILPGGKIFEENFESAAAVLANGGVEANGPITYANGGAVLTQTQAIRYAAYNETWTGDYTIIYRVNIPELYSTSNCRLWQKYEDAENKLAITVTSLGRGIFNARIANVLTTIYSAVDDIISYGKPCELTVKRQGGVLSLYYDGVKRVSTVTGSLEPLDNVGGILINHVSSSSHPTLTALRTIVYDEAISDAEILAHAQEFRGTPNLLLLGVG